MQNSENIKKEELMERTIENAICTNVGLIANLIANTVEYARRIDSKPQIGTQLKHIKDDIEQLRVEIAKNNGKQGELDV